MPPEFKREADLLVELAHSLGITNPEHLDPLLQLYWQVRTDKVPGGMVMFADGEVGKLHILSISKTEDNEMRISDGTPSLSREDEAELVRQIIDQEVDDPDKIGELIAVLQLRSAVVH